ncbi:unnamed protein product, partial [Lymnaea stagnalis]
EIDRKGVPNCWTSKCESALSRLREGVLNDLDRQQRKLLNIHQLQVQSDLTKILKEHQKEQDEKDNQLNHVVR